MTAAKKSKHCAAIRRSLGAFQEITQYRLLRKPHEENSGMEETRS